VEIHHQDGAATAENVLEQLKAALDRGAGEAIIY